MCAPRVRDSDRVLPANGSRRPSVRRRVSHGNGTAASQATHNSGATHFAKLKAAAHSVLYHNDDDDVCSVTLGHWLSRISSRPIRTRHER